MSEQTVLDAIAALDVRIGAVRASVRSLAIAPTDGVWTRHSPATVLAPTQAWEGLAIQEFHPMSDGAGGLRAWAKGGWGAEAIGYYTSPDGIVWTPYAGNPVLGLGGSGAADTMGQPMVYEESGIFYLYVNAPVAIEQDPYVYTSTDGIAWTVANGGTPYTSFPTTGMWGNRTMWKEGADYYMLQEWRSVVGELIGSWQLYLLRFHDPTTFWYIDNDGLPLTGLQPVDDYLCGGASLKGGGKVGEVYDLYYHAGVGATTDLYHATSLDRVNWVVANGGAPVLVHSGVAPEDDQASDANLIFFNGVWTVFFSAVDNSAGAACIQMATLGSSADAKLDAVLLKTNTIGGAGAIAWPYSLTVNGMPCADAAVWITSDEAGNNVVSSGRTDDFGALVPVPRLDAGTYYFWAKKSGVNFISPDIEVIA